MSKPVILLVEDEVDLLQVTEAAVRRAMPDFDVQTSTSIEEAEEVLLDLEATGVPLALAVVDHVLGGGTGLDLLEWLRSHFPDSPVMLFTGRASETVEARARAVGAKVMWKPVRLQKFLGEIQEMVSSGTG